MSRHFQWYPSGEGSDETIPWNAKYAFPSQTNKCVKSTPRIPPKNGAVFGPGNVIRVEFPAQGYVNAVNTTLEFDVTLMGWSGDANQITRFQNNIQSIFSRVRVLYGSTPLEDIINYNVIVRSLTEWTATNGTGSMDQTSIADGIGGWVAGHAASGEPGMINVRQHYIQGIDGTNSTAADIPFGMSDGSGPVPNKIAGDGVDPGSNPYYCSRRYQINLATGLFTQDKLIPTKFMASQFAVELTLAQPKECIYSQVSRADAVDGAVAVIPATDPVTYYAAFAKGTPPTYKVSNINLIPEILEFDASYDQGLMTGLANGGVPIKFATWHTYIFNIGGSSTANLQIQERSRSVKALFGVQRRNPPEYHYDSGATFFDSSNTATVSCMQSYQYRIGARYFPASPVQLATSVGAKSSNGGAEAFIELQKALNCVGDYRLSTSSNPLRWGLSSAVGDITLTGDLRDADQRTNLSEMDYDTSITHFDNTNGRPLHRQITRSHPNTGYTFCGNTGSSCFVSAIDLETSSGVEISGLNAEEQSDISFIATWGGSQRTDFVFEVYTYVDQMIILKENNMLEVIQ